VSSASYMLWKLHLQADSNPTLSAMFSITHSNNNPLHNPFPGRLFLSRP
jgi:hypothetical protein